MNATAHKGREGFTVGAREAWGHNTPDQVICRPDADALAPLLPQGETGVKPGGRENTSITIVAERLIDISRPAPMKIGQHVFGRRHAGLGDIVESLQKDRFVAAK